MLEDGSAVGTLEASYAERLAPADRFVLDGRALEVRRLEAGIVHARPTGGEPNLPRWTSDRQSLSPELARELAAFRSEAGLRLAEEGAAALRGWLMAELDLEPGRRLGGGRAVRGPGAMERGPRRRWAPDRGVAHAGRAGSDPTRSTPRCTARPARRWRGRPAPDSAEGSAATWSSGSPTWAGRSASPTTSRSRPRNCRRSWTSIASMKTCSRAWTGASCWPIGSAMSPRRP